MCQESGQAGAAGEPGYSGVDSGDGGIRGHEGRGGISIPAHHIGQGGGCGGQDQRQPTWDDVTAAFMLGKEFAAVTAKFELEAESALNRAQGNVFAAMGIDRAAFRLKAKLTE